MSPTVVVLATMSAVAVATAVIVVLLPSGSPRSLATPEPIREVTAISRTDADEKQVQLTLETGASQPVTTSRQGIVTALNCTTGGTIRSGDTFAAVDGLPVIALATTTPLWRDIDAGEQGEDVEALQRELTRLGAGTRVDGIAGPSTMRAARTFLAARGLRLDEEAAVPRDAFAWTPSVETPVRSCEAAIGTAVTAAGELALLPPELKSARIESIPAGAISGDRQITMGEVSTPVSRNGIIDDPVGLAAISSQPQFATAVTAAEGTPAVPASWSLVEPQEVDVVPPTALWDVRDGSACLQPVGRSPVLVELIGSELGQSFVQPGLGVRLDRLDASPDRRRPCR